MYQGAAVCQVCLLGRKADSLRRLRHQGATDTAPSAEHGRLLRAIDWRPSLSPLPTRLIRLEVRSNWAPKLASNCPKSGACASIHQPLSPPETTFDTRTRPRARRSRPAGRVGSSVRTGAPPAWVRQDRRLKRIMASTCHGVLEPRTTSFPCRITFRGGRSGFSSRWSSSSAAVAPIS